MSRLTFTVLLLVLAITAASAGVLLWRHLNPPQTFDLAAPPAGVSNLPESGEVTAPEGGLKIGDRRPEVRLRDLDDNMRSVSEWDGKLLFVNFWATWCPPCLEEIPAFVRLHERYRERGVEFLGIALDSPDKVRDFMQRNRVSYESLHGEKDAIDAARAFGNSYGALPFTAVVGRDGRIIKLHAGVLQESEAEALIEAHS